MDKIKIETRRGTEAWFLLCYASTIVEALWVYNQQRTRGYKVRLSNSRTGFVIQQD